MAGKATAAGGPADGPLNAHILIIEARFYEDIADEMAAGAMAVIEAHGSTYERVAVPGALEIPQVLIAAVDTGRFEGEGDRPPFDGVVVLGCVIRGETYHFEVVCDHANHWLMQAAMDHGIPVGNAILTVDTRAQALERAQGGAGGKGGDAARACLRLIEIARQFAGQDA